MFTTSDLSLNQYHHVFFQVARDTSNVITTYMYDNALNALGTLDTSFGTHPILNVFQVLDASGSNPLVIGKGSSYQYNLDVAHFSVYNRTLTTTQQALLMNYTNQTFLEPHTESTLYMVSASGGKFYIDNVEAPVLDVSHGIYVFDQRDSTNGIHPLRLSTVSDGTHNGGTEYTRGVVTNGTPGSINAYTLIQIDNLTPPILYYYCSNHGGMGSMLSLVDYTYFVKVVQNAIGDYVYAFSEDGVTYYNQPQLSFVAPYVYQFNLVGSMTNYDLVFGTEVDNANTEIDSYYITSINSTQFVLDLRNHNGNALYYFDASFNNMGYYTYPSVGSIDEGAITVTDPLDGVINANPYTVSGYHNIIADGIYDLSASSYVETTNLFYKVLDVSGTGFDWLTTGNLYDSDGKYTGTTSTMIGNVEYKGEWIQLHLPYHLVLSELTTNNDATDLDSSPKTVHLLGSNDNGSTFDYLSEAALAKTTATTTTFSSVYQRYSTFRMIVEDTHGGSNVHLGFWSLKGTAVREYPENSVAHTMTVSGSPEVYYVDNIPQDEIDFSINVVYLFDQSDTTNANYQVFFSGIADGPTNTGYMEIVGSPGRTGAYTKLQLDGTYPGQWFYYSTTRDYMGYGPMELGPDSFNKVAGDVVTFTVINRTGVVEPYSITGVTSADIGGADLSGIIEYGRKYDLSYSLVTANKTMVFAVGDASSSLVIGDYKYYEVAVQTNVVGKPVFAFYDTTDAVWYNQPELSFHKQQVYEFDLSNSVTDNSYVLVFGTEMDNSGTVLSSSTFVDRSQNNKVILNLRDYIGESLVYFEDSSAGMGYVEQYQLPTHSTMETLVVGGGGQGSSNYGGGGGAGGMLTPSFSFAISGYSVNVEVGAGGNGWTSGSPIPAGPDGGNSSYGSSYIAIGGGGGGGQNANTTSTTARSGGSGGGGGAKNSGNGVISLADGGVATPGQGNDGGDGTYLPSSQLVYWSSGGGGGAGGAGGDAPNGYGGHGGDAKQWYVDLEYYAAGGGGGTRANGSGGEPNPTDQIGGSGGFGGGIELGGHGQPLTAGGAVFTGTGGAPNTGSGGGGGFATDANTGVQQGGADGVVKVWVPLSYTFISSHLSNATNNISCTSSALTYNNTDGTLVTFTGAGTATWTPAWAETNIISVTVSNEIFYLDNSANPQIDFSANTSYLFDQSDPTNDGQQIVFGYTVDDSANILTSADGVIVMGTPGRPGAYTQLDLSSGFVGQLYYYSDGSANMGQNSTIPVDISYSFTVRTNVIGEPVWALYDSSNGVWYNQPDLSFSSPNVYEFYVSDTSNNGYVLSFGTTVDVSDATIESTYVTRTTTPGMADAKVLLDLRDYNGQSLVYFEDSSVGMGYKGASGSTHSYTVTVSNEAYVLKQNGYLELDDAALDNTELDVSYQNVSSSYSYGSVYLDYKAFGEYTHDGKPWYENQSSWSTYQNTTTYYTNIDGVNVTGDWLQVDLESKKQIISFHIVRINDWDDVGQGQLKEFYVVGSNDNTTFTELGHYYGANIPALNSPDLVIPEYYSHIDSNTLNTNNILQRTSEIIHITTPGEYRYLRFVMHDVHTNAAVSNIRLFESPSQTKPQIDFSANESYLFDQSDPTNAGQQIVFGYIFDNISNILTAADGVTVMGTPGRPGAYTQLDLSSGFVGQLYYYSDGSANMGYEPQLTWNFTQTVSPPNSLTWYNFGGSCIMSRNGLYCVVGTHERSPNYTSYNAVYEYANGSWSLKGSVISEPNNQYSYPLDVWISNDGTHIATKYAGASSSTSGYVRIYEYISGSWTQKGSTVSQTSRFGAYLSMSDDGNTFACSDTSSGSSKPPIYVYDYNGNSWGLRGGTSVSVSGYTIRGGTCCISSDGLRLAAMHRSGSGATDGYVVDWNSSTGTWSVVGDVFPGVSDGEISSACYIGENKDFVTTSPRTNAHTGLVWKYDSTTNSWARYGSALASPPTENTSGIGYTFFPPIINATGTKVGYLDKQYEYNSRTNTWDVKMDFNYNIIGYSDTSVALSNTSSVSNTSTDNANFKIDFYNYY